MKLTITDLLKEFGEGYKEIENNNEHIKMLLINECMEKIYAYFTKLYMDRLEENKE